jgi:mannosyltransferase
MAAAVQPGGVRRWQRDAVWPVAAGGLLALLSAYQLGARGLWRDEIASVVFASSPISALIRTVATTGEASQAVYYLVLHVWLKADTDEAWIRLLSLLFGVATILPIYAIGRRIGGQIAGTLASFVFAGSRFVVRYDQEARGYSMAMFVAAILTWLLLRALDRPTAGRWAAYGLLAAVGFYVHFFFVFVVGSHVLFVAATRSWPRRRALAAAGIPVVIAALPLPVIVLLQSSGRIDWIPPLTADGVVSVLASVAGGPALLAAMIGLSVLAVRIYGRARTVWLVMTWLVVPPAAVVLISLFRPLLVDRYLAVSVPAMAILAGAALAGIRPRGAMVASVAGVALLLLIALPQVYARSSEDWRSAAQWIATASRPGDRIVFQASLGYRALRYYLPRVGAVTRPEQVETAEAEADPTGPVWVVLKGVDAVQADRIRAGLQQRYVLVEERSVGGDALISIALFRPSG